MVLVSLSFTTRPRCYPLIAKYGNITTLLDKTRCGLQNVADREFDLQRFSAVQPAQRPLPLDDHHLIRYKRLYGLLPASICHCKSSYRRRIYQVLISSILPSHSPNMDAEYLAERERLIAEDRQWRVDALAPGEVTDEERKADEIVRKIRAQENETVWGPNAPPIPGSLHLFPGMGFLTGASCSP